MTAARGETALEPPVPSDPVAAPPAFDPTGKAAWRAVIGPHNTDYYLAQFHPAGSAPALRRWHWPAFFVTWYWLIHRRMYGWAVLYAFSPVLALFPMLAAASITKPGSILVFAVLACYLAAVVVGAPVFANPLYRKHLSKIMIDAQHDQPLPERYLGRLERKGGTIGWGYLALLFCVVLLFVVFVVGILAAIAIPAYQDYTRRAMVSETILAATVASKQVAEVYETTGAIPHSIDDLPYKVARARYVSTIELDAANGVITVVTTVQDRDGPVSFRLVPTATADRKVSWTCRPVSGSSRLLPASCRGS